MRALIHPRAEITDTLERIYSYRMTTTSGGNLSIKDSNGDIWITPARIDKGSMRREDIICIRCSGEIEGLHKPSSEHPFHQSTYRNRPDIGAIVHAHPVALVSFSICRKIPDTKVFPQAAHVCGKVGYAPYEMPGSAALGESIAAAFGRKHNCVILENHGVAVGGRNLQEAFERFETLEFAAKTIIKAGMIGQVRYLSDAQIALSEIPRTDVPAFAPTPATTREQALRQELCDFIRRGYRQRLLTSTGGSFSARLSDDTFLITCYHIDRKTITLDQLALVKNGQVEAGKVASRALRIHEAIYRKHKDVHSVVNANPVNATAFSITGVPLDARTIPESYIFLLDVLTVPFAAQYGNGEEVAELVSMRRPAALMENNGVLVLGRTVLDAFDRLEVLESTAEALINAKPIGALQPMTPGQIQELATAFNLT